MRRILIFAIFLPLLFAEAAIAQTPTPIVPQSQQLQILTAVTTAQATGCLTNQGQNTWFSNYIVAGGTPTAIQYRLEFSYNSDAATCSTGTWFQMSDDATDLTQGEVIGVGPYPYVRANLAKCVGCGTPTVSAWYSTTSASSSTLNGFYNPSQQTRKVLFIRAAANTNQNITGIPAPYGSTAGFIVFNTNGSLPATVSIQVTVHFGSLAGTLNTFVLPATVGSYTIAIPEGATPATSVDVLYTANGSTNRQITAYYYFYPPGQTLPYGAQPLSMSLLGGGYNSEAVSAVNTAVSTVLEIVGSATGIQRAHLFSVNARCSAGTAQLVVNNGGTTNSFGTSAQMWSSGTTEVGTTTFKFQWNPGLSSDPGNGMSITLSTCGAGNTGTLDVQGSVF